MCLRPRLSSAYDILPSQFLSRRAKTSLVSASMEDCCALRSLTDIAHAAGLLKLGGGGSDARVASGEVRFLDLPDFEELPRTLFFSPQ